MKPETKSILICGIGAIGSNLAALLAVDLRDKHKITILDMDTVEERNYRAGTQVYFKEQKGQRKVDALQYYVYKQFGRKIDIIHSDVSGVDIRGFDLIIDCLDNKFARERTQNLWDFAGDKKFFHLVHIGFSPNFTYNIQWAGHYEVPEDVEGFDICEAEGAASFVKMVAATGSLVIQNFLSTQEELEVVGNKFGFRTLT